MAQATRIRAAVFGSTGYIGMQCTALLAGHPRVELTRVLGHTSAGKRYSEVVPGSSVDLIIEDSLDPGSADVVMAALPHTVAASLAPGWLAGGATVIDCSADFRLRDASAYQQWYGIEHRAGPARGGGVRDGRARARTPRRRESHLGARLLPDCHAARLHPRAARGVDRAGHRGGRQERRQRRGARGEAGQSLRRGQRVGARLWGLRASPQVRDAGAAALGRGR